MKTTEQDEKLIEVWGVIENIFQVSDLKLNESFSILSGILVEMSYKNEVEKSRLIENISKLYDKVVELNQEKSDVR